MTRRNVPALLRFSGGVDRDPAIETWLDTQPAELGSLARTWFTRMRNAGPCVAELMHDGVATACVQDAPFAYVGAFKAHVNIGFFHGASLPDPAGLLEGSGKHMRHAKLRPHRSVDTSALEALVAAAYSDIVARLHAAARASLSHAAQPGRWVPQTGRTGTISVAKNKTIPTDASVEDYIASRASERQRADCHELMALLQKLTGRRPTMWGPSIVGYGVYRYTYESGRTGEAPVTGFAIRGRELVLYLLAEGDRQKSLLSKLGKHRMGKACLYFKQLADLDKPVLEQLVAGSIAEVRRRHGRHGGA